MRNIPVQPVLMTQACPDGDLLTGFCTGRLDASGAAAVAAHLDTCASCFRRAAQVARTTCAAGEDGDQLGQIVSDVPRRIEEYHLVRRIGHGAMGQVFLAIDLHLDRPVAIKLLKIERAEAAMARFLVEARAVARLSHPNVVTIHRVGEVGRHPYLVYELVRGRSLDHVEKPMTSARVRAIALGLARGLAAAHRAGVLHRDIKPANAMLADDGTVKLLDFGLAKLGDSATEVARPAEITMPPLVERSPSVALTATGAFLGTPLYMAPETWRDEPPSPASDVYSLGAVLWELCTGRALRAGMTYEQVKDASRTPPPAVGERAPGIDPGLARVIDRCLAAAPSDRFASAEELVVALEQPRARRTRRWLAPAALALALVAVALAAVFALRRQASAPAAAPVAAPAEQICSLDHWCWDASMPTQMHHVWARAKDDAWSAGDRGTVRRWDGTRWNTVPTRTFADLNGVHGSAADDVWIVGTAGTALHWDGQLLHSVPTNTQARLIEVLALARNDAWAVGEDGIILHWDGHSWSPTPSGAVEFLGHITARAPDDVWVAGHLGTVLHWDGSRWTRVDADNHTMLTGIAVIGGEIWIVGYNGVLKRLHEGRWLDVELPIHPIFRPWAELLDIWASGPDDIWVTQPQKQFLHWDGRTWNLVDPGTHFMMYGIAGSGRGDVWAVSNNHLMLRWDGRAWAPQEPLPDYVDHYGVWAAGANDAWTAGFSTVDGWGPPRHTRVEHFDGHAWHIAPTPDVGGLYAVWGARADDVWFMGEKRALGHWDGESLRFEKNPLADDVTVRAIHGAHTDDVWAVGTGGATLHFDGRAWSVVTSGTDKNLRGVWTAPDGEAWAVGEKGTLLRWQGHAWQRVDSGTDRALLAIWGTGARDVWAAGQDGIMLHWNGTAWALSESATTEHITSLSGSGPNDVWAGTMAWTGNFGTLVHWNGREWNPMPRTPMVIVRGVVSVAHDDVWAVGSSDAKLHYRPAAL